VAKAPASKAPRRPGTIAIKLGVVALIGVLLSALPLCLVLVPGMMPTLAVMLIDRRRPRYLTYAVGIMNSAGVLPFLIVLMLGGLTMRAAAHMLSDPFTWLVMYGAAAAGWCVSLVTPSLARISIEIKASQHRRTLEALSRAMREEWGEEVADSGKTG
jgi:hypothetical protein